MEAILFVMETGGAWRAFPDRFPPWQTVYAQLCCWQESGIWKMIWDTVVLSTLFSVRVKWISTYMLRVKFKGLFGLRRNPGESSAVPAEDII